MAAPAQFLNTLSIVCRCISPMTFYEYCPWIVGVTLIFDGIPQIIVQRYQIAAPMWSKSSATDNAIFKNRAQNIECSFGHGDFQY